MMNQVTRAVPTTSNTDWTIELISRATSIARKHRKLHVAWHKADVKLASPAF
jgi:hypothetical protein